MLMSPVLGADTDRPVPMQLCQDWEELGSADGLPKLDDSLTNLHWLHRFALQDTECQHSAVPHKARSVVAATPASLAISHDPDKPTLTGTPLPSETREDITYTTDPYAKPPYSYATLICLAMKSSDQSKVTLSTIYSWIKHNFCYYRHAEPSWQNSIRHNLSLNKCFQKVPRGKDEPGKGGFWKINAQFEEQLVTSILRRHVLPPNLYQLLQPKGHSLSPSLASHPETSTTAPQLQVPLESVQFLAEFEEISAGHCGWNPSLFELRAAEKEAGPEVTVSGLSPVASSPLLTQEEEEEINSLTGDLDWEVMLKSTLDQECTASGVLETLSPAIPLPGELSHTLNNKPMGFGPGNWSLCSDPSLTPGTETLEVPFQKHPWDEGQMGMDLLTQSYNELHKWETIGPFQEAMRDSLSNNPKL
ncbi:forkhead box protein J1-A-like [Chiloscyllium punctatum]